MLEYKVRHLKLNDLISKKTQKCARIQEQISHFLETTNLFLQGFEPSTNGIDDRCSTPTEHSRFSLH